jgi:hypothetical protein
LLRKLGDPHFARGYGTDHVSIGCALDQTTSRRGALSHAIVEVLSDQRIRDKLSHAGGRTVIEKFGPRNRSEKILDVYQSLVT